MLPNSFELEGTLLICSYENYMTITLIEFLSICWHLKLQLLEKIPILTVYALMIMGINAESVLEDRMHDLDVKSQHLGEYTKQLEEINHEIDHLQSVLLILKVRLLVEGVLLTLHICLLDFSYKPILFLVTL